MRRATLSRDGKVLPLPRVGGVYKIPGGGTAWWVCVDIGLVSGDVTLLDPLARDTVMLPRAANDPTALVEVDPGDARDVMLGLAIGHLWTGRVKGHR